MAGCSNNGPTAAAQFLTLAPFTVDIDANRISGIVGTVFELEAAAGGNRDPIATWTWDFGDGGTATGAAVQHAYAAPGFFLAVVTARDAGGREVAGGILIAVYAQPGAAMTAPGGYPLPPLMGDVDGDGQLTLADAHLLLKHARGLQLLQTEAQILAADLDLDGDLDDEDALLLARAVAAGTPLPRQISPARGPPGTGVNLISPALLGAADIVEVQVGAAAPVPLFRPILGYASLLVPFDAAGATTASLQGTTIAIRILVNGTEEDSFDFELEDPAPIDGEPGAELLEALRLVPALVGELRPALSDYLDFIGADGEERALLEALLQLAEEQFAGAEPQIVEALSMLDAETRTQIHQVANANGLAELLAELQAFLAQRQVQATGDTLIDAICIVKKMEELIKKADSVVGWVCNFVQVCALVPVVVNPAQPVCVALLPACSAFGVANDLIQLVASFTPKPDSKLVVKAEPSSLAAGEQSQLTAFMRLRDVEALCVGGATKLRKHLQKQLALRMFKKVGGVKLAAKILKNYPLDQRGDVRSGILDKLRNLLDFLIGKVLDLLGINKLLDTLQQKICGALQNAAGPLPFTFPLENTIFSNPVPADAGSLQLPAAGSDAPAVFTCQPPDGEQRTVTVAAVKVTCEKTPLQGTVRIECSSGKSDVTITIGDNGNLLDDIFEARVDGVTVLTSSVPVRSIATTIPLTSGPHTVQLVGRAAPDGVGTYFIRFTGITSVSGPPLSGSNLSAGTTFTYTIEVAP